MKIDVVLLLIVGAILNLLFYALLLSSTTGALIASATIVWLAWEAYQARPQQEGS